MKEVVQNYNDGGDAGVISPAHGNFNDLINAGRVPDLLKL